MTPRRAGRGPKLQGTVVFNVSFIIVAFVTVVSFLAILIIPFLMGDDLSRDQAAAIKSALKACNYGFTSGLSGIAGLLIGAAK